LHWIDNTHNSETLFEGNTNFELLDKDLQLYTENGVNWVRTPLESCDENRKERKFIIVETGNLKPWTPFHNKEPVVREVNRPELNKIIAAHVLYIHMILNKATDQEKKARQINWEAVLGTGLQIDEMVLNHQALIKNVI
jgi:hypothetical protein